MLLNSVRLCFWLHYHGLIDAMRRSDPRFLNAADIYIIAIPESVAVTKIIPATETRARRFGLQAGTNIVPIYSRKRAGFTAAGEQKALNPYEKAQLLNSFNVTSFSKVGDSVLSLFGGSGSMMEVCQLTGR